MFRRRAVTKLVEEYIARSEADPSLTPEAFAPGAGILECEAREAIKAYLRVAGLFDGGPTHKETDTGVETLLPDPLAGTIVGGHLVVRLLGRGGTGSVYLATDVALGRNVALKILHPAFMAAPSHRERFRREATAAGRLVHPAIVPVFGAGEDGGAAWISMAHVEGRSLEAVIREGVAAGHAPPAPDDVARLGVALADAIEHAHGAGLIHRDLKPANILLGRGGHPFIVDFGIARDLARTGLTETGHVVGTPAYMAPEQVDPDLGPVDVRTDVFGLGVTLFEYATGIRPFLRPAPTSPSPSAVVRSLPRDFGTILLSAIDPAPSRRYRSASALRDDLARFLARETVVARRPGILLRAGRAVRRRPWRAAALMMFVVSGGILGGASLWESRRRADEIDGQLEAARLLLDKGEFAAVLAPLDRVRSLGGDDRGLRNRAEALRRKREAELLLDEARMIVSDGGRGRTDLELALGICDDVLARVQGAESFHPLLVKAIASFRLLDLGSVEKWLRAAAGARGIPLPEDLVREVRTAAASMVLGLGTEGVLSHIPGLAAASRPSSATIDRILRTVREASGDSTEALLIAGLALRWLDREEESIEIFDLVLEKDPVNWFAASFKTRGYLEIGNLSAATEAASRAVESARELPGFYVLRAEVHQRAGRPQKALDDLDRALHLKPGFMVARLDRAEVLDALRRTQEAVDIYDSVIAADPGNGRALVQRGKIYTWNKRFSLSARDLEAAAGRPEVMETDRLQFLAADYCFLRRNEEAINTADRALGRNRGATLAWFAKAGACLDMQLMPEALASAETAMRLARRLGWPKEAILFFSGCYPEPRSLDGTHFREVHDQDLRPDTLRAKIEEELPILRYDWKDLARRTDLAAALMGDDEETEAESLMRNTVRDAREFGRRPPGGLQRKPIREQLAEDFSGILEEIGRGRRYEVLRESPAGAEILREWREALEGWR